MRRRYRRLWTLSLTLGAGLLILAVVAVGAARMLVKAAPAPRSSGA
jgi:uncharacterized protein YhdP